MSKLELERWKSVGEADPVGKYEVRVIRERSTKGRERYRVKCVRAKLRAAHPDWAWKVFAQDTEDKTMKQLAYEHAFKINEFLIHGDPDNITPHEIESLKNLFAKMKGHNAARKDDPNWAAVTVDDLDPLIDTGIKFQRVLKEHINCSWTAGIENLEMKALVLQFTGWLKSESAKLIAPSFSELLQKCLADKTSSTGGVTGNPLSPAQKSRWERHLGLVDEWIGHLKTSDNELSILNTCVHGIKNFKSKKGKPWMGRSKYHAANSISQFGIWMKDQGHVSNNFFKPLTKRFRVDRSAPPVLLPPAQVEKLFITAANNSKLIDHIPALAVMFGTGCRPSEASYDNDPAWPKKQRRYQWEWAQGWNENRPSEVTGGVALHLPEWADDAQTMRASKTESRMLDMPPNFFAWLKWYFEDIKGGELPTTGQLLFKQGTWDQIRQDAGLFRNSDGKSLWPYDASRNSFTSYANHYVEWKEKAARDYWMDRCGHDYATFKKYYKVQVTQEECHAYFNILPPKKKAPPVKGKTDETKAASQSAASA